MARLIVNSQRNREGQEVELEAKALGSKRGGRGAAREAVSMALENCVGQRKSLVFH